jgi:hypothetical protein
MRSIKEEELWPWPRVMREAKLRRPAARRWVWDGKEGRISGMRRLVNGLELVKQGCDVGERDLVWAIGERVCGVAVSFHEQAIDASGDGGACKHGS